MRQQETVCQRQKGLSGQVCQRVAAELGFEEYKEGASLVAQWLRICLPMQGTRVRALGQEDPTCR